MANPLERTLSLFQKIVTPLSLSKVLASDFGAFVANSQEAWNKQTQAELKLTAAMRQRLGASEAEIDRIRQLTAAQQSLGVISDEMQLAGARQLAAIGVRTQSIETLVPAMNNLLAAQQGLNATDQDAARIGDLVGEAMQGKTAALEAAGIALTNAEKNIMDYGTEEERAATLAQAITGRVGEMNSALAATPEGSLRQHANSIGDLQERIGRLVSAVQATFLPLFDTIVTAAGEVVTWFTVNSDLVLGIVKHLSDGIRLAFSVVWKVVGFVLDLFGKWYSKLQEGSVPVMLITGLLGALALSMAILTAKAKAMALWTSIVTTAKWAWAAAQNGLNLALLVCPVTWIVAGIITLIGVITYLCYKIDGWGSLWDGIVGYMKYSFLAFVEGVKLGFSTVVNGIMAGIDTLKLGWYKFKEACGIGDSSENQAAIARIHADMEARQQAIIDGAAKIAENTRKAQESLDSIHLSWNSDKSLGDVVNGLKSSVGIEMPATSAQSAMPVDALSAGSGFGNSNLGIDGGFGGTGTSAVSAIAGNNGARGGGQPTSVTIHLGSLVENLSFGSYDDDRDTMQHDLESALIRVLQMANSAL